MRAAPIFCSSTKLRTCLLEFQLCIGPVRVSDLPGAVDPLIYLGLVPPRCCLGPSRELRAIVGQIERQHSEITHPLNLWVNHVVAVDLDLPRNGCVVFSHRFQTIGTLLQHWIKVGYLLGINFQVSLRIALAPPVERPVLERNDLLGIETIGSRPGAGAERRGNSETNKQERHGQKNRCSHSLSFRCTSKAGPPRTGSEF